MNLFTANAKGNGMKNVSLFIDFPPDDFKFGATEINWWGQPLHLPACAETILPSNGKCVETNRCVSKRVCPFLATSVAPAWAKGAAFTYPRQDHVFMLRFVWNPRNILHNSKRKCWSGRGGVTFLFSWNNPACNGLMSALVWLTHFPRNFEQKKTSPLSGHYSEIDKCI